MDDSKMSRLIHALSGADKDDLGWLISVAAWGNKTTAVRVLRHLAAAAIQEQEDREAIAAGLPTRREQRAEAERELIDVDRRIYLLHQGIHEIKTP